jgi:hypothetical protein
MVPLSEPSLDPSEWHRNKPNSNLRSKNTFFLNLEISTFENDNSHGQAFDLRKTVTINNLYNFTSIQRNA